MGEVIDISGSAVEAKDDLRLARMDRNDKGMCDRVVARYGHLMAYTTELGWCCYDDQIWRTDHRGEQQARRFTLKAVNKIWGEIAALKAEAKSAAKEAEDDDDEEGKPKKKPTGVEALSKFRLSSGNTNKVAAALRHAELEVAGQLEDFDPDLFRLSCTNGTIDFEWHGGPCVSHTNWDGKVTVVDLVAGVMKVGLWDVEALPDRMWRVGETSLDQEDLLKGVPMGDRGGVVKLHDWLMVPRFGKHDPAHRVTRITTVAYDPAAKCPQWEKNLAECLPDAAAREFFQTAMGYGLTGETSSQCFLMLQGKGADGKSTLMRVILRIMGLYGQACDPRSFLEMKPRSAAEASPDVANWAGDLRMLYTEEPPKNAYLNEALIKQVTGGVPMRARHLNRGEFEFTPRFFFTIAFNDMLRVRGGDAGFWRRVRIIRFTESFTPAQQQAAGDVHGRLMQEAPGILNWLIAGMARWRREGLPRPDWMEEDVQSFRSESNAFQGWFNTHCEVKPGHRQRFQELYDSYKMAMESLGQTEKEIMTPNAFGRALTSLQVRADPHHGDVRMRVGAKLKQLAKPSEYDAPAKPAEDGVEIAPPAPGDEEADP